MAGITPIKINSNGQHLQSDVLQGPGDNKGAPGRARLSVTTIQDPFFGTLQLRLGPVVPTSQLPTAAQAAERGGLTIASPVVVSEGEPKKAFPVFVGEEAEALLDNLIRPVYVQAALRRVATLDEIRQMVGEAFSEYHLLIDVVNGTKHNVAFSNHPLVRPSFIRSLRVGSQNFTILFGYPPPKTTTSSRPQVPDRKPAADPTPLVFDSADPSPLVLNESDALPLSATGLKEKNEAELLDKLHIAARNWKSNSEDPALARALRNATVNYVSNKHLGTAPSMVDAALSSSSSNYLNYFRLPDGTTILNLEDLPRINEIADAKVREAVHVDHAKVDRGARGK